MMRQYIFSLTRSPHAAVLLRAAKKLRLREDFAKAPVMGLKKSKKKMKSCAHAHTHTHTHTHTLVLMLLLLLLLLLMCAFSAQMEEFKNYLRQNRVASLVRSFLFIRNEHLCTSRRKKFKDISSLAAFFTEQYSLYHTHTNTHRTL